MTMQTSQALTTLAPPLRPTFSRTCVNVYGDACVAAVVDRRAGGTAAENEKAGPAGLAKPLLVDDFHGDLTTIYKG